jgi:hypothetical protein
MAPTLQRLPDWKPRLIKMINDRSGAEFIPGRTDCVSLAASAVQAVTGVWPRPIEWHNADQARERFDRLGFEDAFGVNHILGEPLTDPKLLRFGDIARLPARFSGMRELPPMETYSVYVGDGCLLAPGRKSLVAVRAELACKVWHVG